MFKLQAVSKSQRNLLNTSGLKVIIPEVLTSTIVYKFQCGLNAIMEKF